MPGGVGGRAWGGQAERWNPSAELGVPPAQEGPSVISRMLSLVLREPGRWWESPQNQSKREERRPHQGLSGGCRWEGPAGHQEAQGGRRGSHCQLSGDTGVLAV